MPKFCILNFLMRIFSALNQLMYTDAPRYNERPPKKDVKKNLQCCFLSLWKEF